MHDNRVIIEDRINRVLTERIRPAIHRTVAPLSLAAWHVEGGQGEPVPPAEAIDQSYEPFAVGGRWGPAWGTTWFAVTGQVPAEAAGREVELIVDLGWHDHSPGFQAEGLVYRRDGSVVKGLNPFNTWIPVSQHANGESIDLLVEAAANPTILSGDGFLTTDRGEKTTAGTDPLYQVTRADICVLEREVYDLAADCDALQGLMLSLGEQDQRRFEILDALERALDRLILTDIVGTAAAARAELVDVLATPAYPGAHQISAIGHAHIDSAWLWPVRETKRKVARTCANVVNLLRENPDLVYGMSSAQQFEWIEQERPEVFAEVQEQVKAGRFIPIGGMWVESDTNLVGGEAMARQFLYGKSYFLDHFGVDCTEVWLPDSFGYTAALPQLVTLAGMDHFLTQKISWNQRNVFPHHSFQWEGIDGTRVFTHFPPVDTYNSDLSGRELEHAASNFRDKGKATRSLVPFGFGDGGGGPTREMLERARRTANLAGSPQVQIESPREFFTKAVDEYPHPQVWAGELYLEIHRGTYTSHGKTKQGNRRSEHLLREAELWASTAAVRGLADYPAEQLHRIWKQVLLQQFHDILPGSSIAWVHREAAENYAAIAQELTSLIGATQAVLAGPGDSPVTFNANPFVTSGVPALGAAALPIAPIVTADSADRPVTVESVVEPGNEYLVLDNGILRVTIDRSEDRGGLVMGIRDLVADREVLPAGTTANRLELHQDFPNRWDAWDVDYFYRNEVTAVIAAESVGVINHPDGAVTVQVQRKFGDSTVQQDMTLRPGSRQLDCMVDVDWHEQEKFLKAAFPIDVHTDHAAYETQFGHIVRPTHTNTSWDDARFEVCAHRWVQVGEPGYGAAIVNDATYGHDVTRHPSPSGATYTEIRLSLLRAPRFPDPQTDQGRHVLRYAIVAGADVVAAAEAGYRINLPLRTVVGSGEPVAPLVSASDGAFVEAVKLAHDGSGDVIVRLYEPAGKRANIKVQADFDVAGITEVDLIERPLDASDHVRKLRRALISTSGDAAELALAPFQIVTLRLAR